MGVRVGRKREGSLGVFGDSSSSCSGMGEMGEMGVAGTAFACKLSALLFRWVNFALVSGSFDDKHPMVGNSCVDQLKRDFSLCRLECAEW